jgi:hypothetical protein
MKASPQWIARNALHNLDARGWNKGSGTGFNGEWCMAVAMHMDNFLIIAGRIDPEDLYHAYEEAWQVIGELYPERYTQGVPYAIGDFNDHPDTTEEDVRRVLKFLAEAG